MLSTVHGKGFYDGTTGTLVHIYQVYWYIYGTVVQYYMCRCAAAVVQHHVHDDTMMVAGVIKRVSLVWLFFSHFSQKHACIIKKQQQRSKMHACFSSASLFVDDFPTMKYLYQAYNWLIRKFIQLFTPSPKKNVLAVYPLYYLTIFK